MTITIKNDAMELNSTFFRLRKMNILQKGWLTLRFGGFLTLFLLDPKYLVVLLLLVLLLLIVQRFQRSTAAKIDADAKSPTASVNRAERHEGFRKSVLNQVRSKLRWKNELKDRKYEKEIEKIFDRIRESSKEEYQEGIEEIQKLLHLRQQNLSQSILSKTLR